MTLSYPLYLDYPNLISVSIQYQRFFVCCFDANRGRSNNRAKVSGWVYPLYKLISQTFGRQITIPDHRENVKTILPFRFACCFDFGNIIETVPVFIHSIFSFHL